MPTMSRGLLVGSLSVISLLAPAAANAASATVEAVGAAGPRLAQVQVTTAPASIVKDGDPSHSCTGTSAAGALDLATGGAWNGTWSDGFGYGVETILGENYPFGAAFQGKYWAFYLNGIFESRGLCGAELVDADRVQLYVLCSGSTNGCYAGEPMQLTAPRTVAPGTPFDVRLTESATSFGGPPEFATTTVVGPSAGAQIAGQTTDAAGNARIQLAARGTTVITATKGDRPPASATVCVTDGADGFCGTSAPGQPGPAQPPTFPAPCQTTGNDGLCGTTDTRPPGGSIGSVEEQQRFARSRAPRTLAGVATDAQGVRRVQLRLTRTNGRACARFDGRRERFVSTKKCGAANALYFDAGTSGDWSYLLPSRLTKGRYVLDVRTTDATGNVDRKLERGRNRVVFFVS